jgi:hypothetical protein
MTSLRPYADPIAPFFGSIASSLGPYAISSALPRPDFLLHSTHFAVQVPLASEIRRLIATIVRRLFGQNLLRGVTIDYKFLFAVLLAFLPVASLFAASDQIHACSDEVIRRIREAILRARHTLSWNPNTSPVLRHPSLLHTDDFQVEWTNISHSSDIACLCSSLQSDSLSSTISGDGIFVALPSPSTFFVSRSHIHQATDGLPPYRSYDSSPAMSELGTPTASIVELLEEDSDSDGSLPTRNDSVENGTDDDRRSPSKTAHRHDGQAAVLGRQPSERYSLDRREHAEPVENFHLQAHILDLRSRPRSSRSSHR